MVFGELRKKLKGDIVILEAEISKIDWREYDYWGKVKPFREEINRLKKILSENILVTKHARQRYFERIGKKLVLSIDVLNTISNSGDGKYIMDDGSVLVVRNKMVVTTLTINMVNNNLTPKQI